MHFLLTKSVHPLSNDRPFKLHTPRINLVLDYPGNFKLLSVVHYEQLMKLHSVLNTWYSMESFQKKLTICKLKFPSESSTMTPTNIVRTLPAPCALILKLTPKRQFYHQSVFCWSLRQYFSVWSLRCWNLIH